MSKKRERLDIILSILESIRKKGGISNPTNVMYKSNLSHKRMLILIEELKNKELIEIKINNNKKEYCLTKKGYDMIDEIKKINPKREI